MRMMAAVCVAAVAITGCARDRQATGAPLAGAPQAHATLATGTGQAAGTASATEVTGGVRFTADIAGLPPGTHGIHIHTTGRCDPPGFETAGGHWNPTAMQHGTLNPRGPHEGDLPNIIVGTDGRGTIGATIPGATLASLLDADGAAIVVHAGPDDLKTDPSGNSGGRIACGVFQAG